MKITRIYVERLKSYGDYSNRTVGLEAILDENEGVKEAYLKLAQECETLLELKEIRAKKEELERELEALEKKKKLFEEACNECRKLRKELEYELERLHSTLQEIESVAEEKLKFQDKIMERLKAIKDTLRSILPNWSDSDWWES